MQNYWPFWSVLTSSILCAFVSKDDKNSLVIVSIRQHSRTWRTTGKMLFCLLTYKTLGMMSFFSRYLVVFKLQFYKRQSHLRKVSLQATYKMYLFNLLTVLSLCLIFNMSFSVHCTVWPWGKYAEMSSPGSRPGWYDLKSIIRLIEHVTSFTINEWIFYFCFSFCFPNTIEEVSLIFTSLSTCLCKF